MTKSEILSRMESLGFTRQSLAAAIGYKYEYVRNSLTPTAPEPSPKFAAVVERAFSEEERRREVDTSRPDASVWDLVYFSGSEMDRIDRAKKAGGYTSHPPMFRDAVIEFADRLLAKEAAAQANITPISSVAEDPAEYHVGDLIDLPYYGTVAAGTPGGPVDTMDGTHPVRGEYDPASHFVLRVNGRSMEPEYPDESFIVCRKLRSGEFPSKGQDVIACDPSGGYFKRLLYTKYGKKSDSPRKSFPHLVSINPEFPEVVPLADCPISAVVVGKV